MYSSQTVSTLIMAKSQYLSKKCHCMLLIVLETDIK